MVGGAGFELGDPLLPKQMRYQLYCLKNKMIQNYLHASTKEKKNVNCRLELF